MNLNGMVSRRNFIQLGASAALALATLPQWSIGNAAAAARPRLVSLDTCLMLSPQEMAERSELVQQAYQYLLHTVQSIQDNDLRQQVLNIIDNPAPTVMQRYPEESDRRELWQRLLAAQYIDGQASAEQLIPPFSTPTRSVQPWLSAPGSGYGSHHSYPGGLSTHTAANVSIALSIHRTYQDILVIPSIKTSLLPRKLCTICINPGCSNGCRMVRPALKNRWPAKARIISLASRNPSTAAYRLKSLLPRPAPIPIPAPPKTKPMSSAG